MIVRLPGAPGALHPPAPLVLPVAVGDAPWDVPTAGPEVRELAAFLAVVDVAPPGAVLDIAARSGEHALLAAVYSARSVRAVQADADRAHAERQAAATNALPVVVEERRLEDLDEYVARTGVSPAVLRLGPGADPRALVADGLGVVERLRPWLVVPPPAAPVLLWSVLRTLRYADAGDGVLAPEPLGTAFARRAEAWTAALAGLAPDVVADLHEAR